MTKNKKIVVTLIPLSLLLCGGIIYLQLFRNPDRPTQPVQENTAAWADEIKADTAVRLNKAEAIRKNYQKDNPNKQLYDGISFGEEEIEDKTESGNGEVTLTAPQKPLEKGVKKKIRHSFSKPKESEPVAAPVVRRVRKGFLGSNGTEISVPETMAIDCAVLEDVQATSGGIINLILMGEVVIKGEKIPKNTLIQALVSFDDKRMNLVVSSIGSQAGSWSGYDTHGNKGFVVTGKNGNDQIAKELAEEAVNTGTSIADEAINVPLLGRLGSRIGSRKMQDKSMTIPKGFKVKLK